MSDQGRVERVEFLLEPLLAALARVDRAADRGPGGARLHARPPLGHDLPSSPKNRKPFMCEPVIALATAVSEP